jgi:hypothetical protein
MQNWLLRKIALALGAQSRDFSRQFQRFKPIPDEEGTETFSVLHVALRVHLRLLRAAMATMQQHHGSLGQTT